MKRRSVQVSLSLGVGLSVLVAFALRAEDKVNMSSMVAADMDYAVPSGTQRVRVVVRDAGTGKLGTTDLRM